MWEIIPLTNIKCEESDDHWDKPVITIDDTSPENIIIKEEPSILSNLVSEVKVEQCLDTVSECSSPSGPIEMEESTAHEPSILSNLVSEVKVEQCLDTVSECSSPSGPIEMEESTAHEPSILSNLVSEVKVEQCLDTVSEWSSPSGPIEMEESTAHIVQKIIALTDNEFDDDAITVVTENFSGWDKEFCTSDGKQEQNFEKQKSIDHYYRNPFFSDGFKGWDDNSDHSSNFREWCLKYRDVAENLTRPSMVLEVGTNEILKSKTSQLKESTSSYVRNYPETKGTGLSVENNMNTSANNIQYICCNCKNISRDKINAENEKPFQCNICEYVGLSSEDLKKHMNTHIKRNCSSDITEKVIIVKNMVSKDVQCSEEMISDDVEHLNTETTVGLSKNNIEVLNLLQNVKSTQTKLQNQIDTTVSDGEEICKINKVSKLKTCKVYNNCKVKPKMNIDSNRSEHSKECFTVESWKDVDKKLKLFPVVLLDNISFDVHKLKNKYSDNSVQTKNVCMKSIEFDDQNQKRKLNYETHKVMVEREKMPRIDQELDVPVTGERKPGQRKKLFKDMIWSEKKKVLKDINGMCNLEEYNKQKLSLKNLKKFKCKLCLFVSASRECVKEHKKVHFREMFINLKSNSKRSANKIVKHARDETSVRDSSESNIDTILSDKKKKKRMDKDKRDIDVTKPSNVVESVDKKHNKVNFDEYKIPKLSQSDKKTLHKCLLCDFKSSSHETLIQHGRVHNRTNITGLKDIVENSDEKSIKKIKINNKRDGNEGKYKCRKCGLRFPSAASYDDHRRNHRKQIVYKCGQCDYSCKTIASLRFHQYTHSGEKPYKCKLCSYSCRRPENLIPHMRVHLGDKPYKCKLCDDSFSQLANLKTHMRTHTGERPYECEECDYKCARLSNLKYHMDKHSGIKPYKCKICNYSCSRSYTLKMHSRRHTGERPYKCTLCNYSASILACLNQHMYVHTGDKPLKCTMCPYRTVYSEALAVHIRSHTGEKPFKCKYCDYSTARNSSLTMHKRIHTGEKPYICSICGFSTARLGNLKVHVRSHTGEKPYPCKTCPVKFTTRSALIIHNRIHTGERPYKCMTCGYGFVASAELKKHIKRKHEKNLYMNEAQTEKTEEVDKN